MTQIKKVKTSEGVQFYPQTHTKAVVDDNGYTVESRMQAVQDVVNQAQMAIGAVPSDLAPTKNSNNWVTSGGIWGSTPSNIDGSDGDLDITDENGHVLARFKDGEFMTKNFNSAQAPIQKESEQADLELSDESNKVLVRFRNGHIETKNFNSACLSKKLGYNRRTSFTVNVDTTNFLSTDFSAEPINSYDTTQVYNDNCVLYLPTNYTADGEPTKIIIYCKHGASTIEPSTDTILSNTDTGRIFRYMLSLGYGILAADGVPNEWATALGLCERAVGNYVAVQSTIKAFEFVKSKYNIDDTCVFIFGYSQGGHYAQNVIDNTNIPIAAAIELSPVCSMRYHQWDLAVSGKVNGVTYSKLARLNIARIFGFPAVTSDSELLALNYDPTKTIGYDPWNRNVDEQYTGFVQEGSLWKLPSGVSINDITMKKHIKCPLKIWAAENDAVLGVDVMKVFIKAIKNSGQVADLQLYTTGAHNIPTYQSPIGTYTENGEELQLYPIAKDMGDWLRMFGGY